MRFLIWAAAAACLTACGGGGDSGGPPAPPPLPTTYNLSAAVASALANGLNFPNMAGSSSAGGSATASYRLQANSDVTYQGVTYKRTTQALTVGSTTIQNFLWWLPSNPSVIAYANSNSGRFHIYTPTGSLPTAATVGQSGNYLSLRIVNTPSATIDIGTGTITWSLEADTDTTALACLNISETVGTVTSTEKDCYRINSAGAISGIRAVATVNGATVTISSF